MALVRGALARSRIIAEVSSRLETHSYVYAAWLEGADALGRVDAYSDIDLWVDVEDGFEADIACVVRDTLSELGTLNLVFEQPQPHPQLRQHFFHLGGTSRFLLLDLNIQAHSRDLAFRRGQDVALVLFDKANVVHWEDAPDFDERLATRKRFLSAQLEVYRRWVEKALARGEFLEALAAYHTYVLEPLIELLRLSHAPHKHDHYLKHVYQDLPKEVAARLEHLYAVDSLATLADHYREAVTWFANLTNA